MEYSWGPVSPKDPGSALPCQSERVSTRPGETGYDGLLIGLAGCSGHERRYRGSKPGLSEPKCIWHHKSEALRYAAVRLTLPCYAGSVDVLDAGRCSFLLMLAQSRKLGLDSAEDGRHCRRPRCQDFSIHNENLKERLEVPIWNKGEAQRGKRQEAWTFAAQCTIAAPRMQGQTQDDGTKKSTIQGEMERDCLYGSLMKTNLTTGQRTKATKRRERKPAIRRAS
ncbi:hypothetical protein LIA77_01456 [Sarocladium implicatum]|nr:hypothetical protein LIA77_01456 [Sarocladium implicatum]